MLGNIGKLFKLFRVFNPFIQDVRDGKKPYESRTVVWNLLVGALVVFYPPAAEWAQANFEAFAGLWAVMNVGLRYATKGKITLKKE